MVAFAKVSLMLVAALICLQVGSTTAKKHGKWHKPDFYHGLDGPRFKVLDSTKEYELREYEKSIWVETNVTSLPFEAAQPWAMKSLYAYQHGANEDGRTINMTTPVATRMTMKDNGAAAWNFTVGIYLPYEYQDGDKRAPKPTSHNVRLTEYGRWKAYVRQVGGFATERVLQHTKEKLHDALHEHKEKFESSWFVAAVYDPPTTISNRTNEVWVPPSSRDIIDGGSATDAMEVAKA